MLPDNTLDQTDSQAESTGAAGRTVSSHNVFSTLPFIISEPSFFLKKRASKLRSQTTARLLRVLRRNSPKPKAPHTPEPILKMAVQLLPAVNAQQGWGCSEDQVHKEKCGFPSPLVTLTGHTNGGWKLVTPVSHTVGGSRRREYLCAEVPSRLGTAIQDHC